jgi:hypothetical protein
VGERHSDHDGRGDAGRRQRRLQAIPERTHFNFSVSPRGSLSASPEDQLSGGDEAAEIVLNREYVESIAEASSVPSAVSTY